MTLLSPTALEAAAKATCESMHGNCNNAEYISDYYTQHAAAAITAYLAQAEKEGWVMVPAKPIGWFNPWNDYHGFQQVAEEYEGGDGVYPFYADQKAHDDLAAAQNGGEPCK